MAPSAGSHRCDSDAPIESFVAAIQAAGARAAEGAAGARGETVISCAGEELPRVEGLHSKAKKLPIEPQDF